MSSTALSHRWRAAVLLCVFSLFRTFPAHAAEGGGERDVLMEALADELRRSADELRPQDLENPYYVEYAVDDRSSHELTGVLGKLENEMKGHDRLLRVGVRVGSHDFDNTGFTGSNSLFGSISAGTRRLAIEDDYMALRRDLWLATDDAFKQASREFAEKTAVVGSMKLDQAVPDFSREEAHQLLREEEVLDFEEGRLRDLVRSLSAVFRDYPGIHASTVHLQVHRITRYYLNTEGSRTKQPSNRVLLYAEAATQADDGMPLSLSKSFFTTALSELPPEEVLRKSLGEMAGNLTALLSAPVGEDYVGPVLFSAEAGADLFARVFIPQLNGGRPPLSSDMNMSGMFKESEFANRLGRRVLPSFIDVADDPTLTAIEGERLFGSYAVDDQGVPARPVILVREGKLETLLMSRRPSKDLDRSNGHGRTFGTRSPAPIAGNVIVTASEGEKFQALKDKVVELCRDEGLSHGLLVTALGSPSRDDLQSFFMGLFSGGGGGSGMGPAASLAYRISVETGEAELVRGLVFKGLSAGSFKDILAAGKERVVRNRLELASDNPIVAAASRAAGFREQAREGVALSVVAPPVLFEELELTKSRKPERKAPLLPPPLAAATKP